MKISTVIRKDIPQHFFVIFSFILMVVVSYYFVSSIVEKQLLVNAQETLNTAEITIRSELREAEFALLHAEMLIGNWLKWEEPYDRIKNYMALLAGNMSSDSAWGHGIMNVYGVINGNRISGLYPESSPEEYIPEQRPWYLTAEAAGGGIGLSSPYFDWGTGIPVISLAKILFNDDGERYGVIALDLDFSALTSYVRSLNFAKGGHGLLCDENFSFLVHPFEDYMNKPAVDVSQGYANLVQGLLKNPDKIFTLRMTNNEGVPEMLIARQIYNGWYLGTATPVSSYYRDVNSMAVMLSLLGISFISIISFILIQLSLSKAHSDEQNLGKSSFLARMSHEIRTPMNSILGMAELIQRKAVSSEIREYIEIINQSGNNLLAIINDILDFSKIESGRLNIQSLDYQIASVINDMINVIRPRAVEKSLDFFVNVDSSIPARLYGDDMRLRQILTNLLSNAVKYTHKGFVSLNLGTENIDADTLRLVCTVHDSGIGIKAEDMGHLFSEFSRVDAVANQGIEGTGLGLTITRALCRAMGGDISVSSEYGKGSEFRASITQKFIIKKPLASVPEPENKQVLFYDWRLPHIKSISDAFNTLGINFRCSLSFQEFIYDLEHGQYDYAFISSKYAMDCIYALGRRAIPLQLVVMVEPGDVSVYSEVTSIQMPVYSVSIANALNSGSDGILFNDKKLRIQFTAPSVKILIVDDISTNLRVAKELMAPYNMNVHTCTSGPEALSLVKNNRYDLVFMDHMMPGMDGIEVTALIRSMESADGYYKELPIIALTANAISGQREMFLEHEIDDFLAKPIDIQKLNDILEKWIPPEKRLEYIQTKQVDSQAKEENLVINGVDTAQGLRNCGGDSQAYIGILADFCNDSETRLAHISEALAQGDTGLYVTLVHALKGAARSVGAMEAGEKASWLEDAAASGNLAVIKDKNNDLLQNMLTLINNIKAAVENYEAENSRENIDLSALHLETLKTALAEMDIEAVNRILLNYAGLSLDKKTRGIISEVEQHILMFEYDKAIEKINELF